MKLFTVGPVEMYPSTLEESGRQLPYFRTDEFSEIMLDSEKMLLAMANAPENSRVVFLTASGTGAMEASVMNCLNENDIALVINGGSFGRRFVEICERHRILNEQIKLPFGKVLTSDDLETHYNKNMTALLVNVHETSTGQLYDLKMMSGFCKKHDLIFIVDAISAFIADEINMSEMGIDVLILSSQKAFALAPGISMVVLSPKAIKIAEKNSANCIYFDFMDYLNNGERGQTPFTPAVGILLTLNSRLRSIKKVGLENVRAAIAGQAHDFRIRAAETALQIPGYPLSNAITPLFFPDGNARTIYEKLRNEYGLNITPNAGKLGSSVLRVGHIGNLTIEDNRILVEAMKKIMERN